MRFSHRGQTVIWSFALTFAFAFVLLGLTLSSLGQTRAAEPAGFIPLNTVAGDYQGNIAVERIGGIATSGSEIGAHDPDTQRLFVVTGGEEMEVLDISNPTSPTVAFTVALSPTYGPGANSVDVLDGFVAVAVEDFDATNNGSVVFFDTDGNFVVSVTVGALPDMLTFTPDGTKLVVANEGEPNDDYDVDPEGSVSVIDISGGIANVTQTDVTNISFTDFNDGQPRAGELPADVRIFGPNASVAQDLEPEYITVAPDSMTAWVVFQENNALGIIDLTDNSITAIAALGFKDHSLPGNEFDASNRDDAINIQNWPTLGMYQPDAIASYEVDGVVYIISANEGDARDYDGFSEEVRVDDLVLDTAIFTDAANLQLDENLGRLKTTTATGNLDMDADFEAIYSYGARSFSIWSPTGTLVYDSGSELERITALLDPASFNSQGSADSFDSRSDDKGPEPEGVAQATIFGREYAFIGLERVGAVVVYDVTDPTAPTFVQALPPTNGDISPEGLQVIDASESPIGKPLLIVNYEVSGSTAIFVVNAAPEPVVAGQYTGSGSEITAFDPDTNRLFTVTGGETMEVVDISDPTSPTLAFEVPISPTYGPGANSIAVSNGYVAAAVENFTSTDDGFVVFFDTDGNFVVSVTVGTLPDMLTFTPDGTKVIVANEGEPNDNYDIDPEGSVSVIDVSAGVPNVTQGDVTQITFEDFNAGGPRAGELPADVRIFGPNASVAQDLEPEYVAVASDSMTAWVVFQENNAIAIIDLTDNSITAIAALGFKDHSLAGNEFDASNEDGGINIQSWPTLGMYQPDAMIAIESNGMTYLVTANEGDARDYDGFSEEVRVDDLILDTAIFTDAANLQLDENLGRLKTTTATGNLDMDPDFEAIYSYGARSFTIWSPTGTVVFDSESDLERLTAVLTPDSFNSQGSAGSFDSRSDDKGPEPEGVIAGTINGRMYLFVGLERTGGIVIYDISDATAPMFVGYIPPTGGDISPEGLLFIPASDSPNGRPLLVVSYEVSGTTTIFELDIEQILLSPIAVNRN